MHKWPWGKNYTFYWRHGKTYRNPLVSQRVNKDNFIFTFGSPITAIPTDNFLFCPPLRYFANVSALSVKSISFKVLFTSNSIKVFGIP